MPCLGRGMENDPELIWFFENNENKMTHADPKNADLKNAGDLQRFFPLRLAYSVLLSIGIVAAAVAIAVWMMKTGPEAKPQPTEPFATLVEVTKADVTSHKTVIEAMGTVSPAREVDLKPQVSGELIEISDNFLPGGLFRSKETLLKIDPADYELIVKQLAGDLARAESELAVERGNQSIAQNEYELLGEDVSDDDLALVLREPQLKAVEAAVQTSRAKLAKAKLDLARTTLKAPFNAVIKSRMVNMGAHVNENTTLATLVGTDEYWIEALVPTHQLKWIQIPRTDSEKGSLVRVYDEASWGKGPFRTGHVIRLAADLEEQGRMARLLVSVPDPMAMEPENADQPRLLIGSYVRIEIQGIELKSVTPVDRHLVRNGDYVWIMDTDNTLDIRLVEIVFRTRDQVMVSKGIRTGERLVVTRLAAPVQGLPLRIEKNNHRTSEMSPVESDIPKRKNP